MKYPGPLARGRLIRRYKRFLADVVLDDGEVVTMHCPNTGAMTHCDAPESVVWYSTSDNPKRKYRHTWELIEVDGHLISVISARANAVVAEALERGAIEPLQGYASVRREVKVDASRFDFELEGHPRDARTCFVEVKSVTLLHDPQCGAGSFPDAVSARAGKHLGHLSHLAQSHRAVLLFCVQHAGIRSVRAAREVDPSWADALGHAIAAGVEVFACHAPPTPAGSEVVGMLPVVAG